MVTVNNFLENVSESLNDAETDYEFTHWGKAYLLSLLNEAIVLISIYRPDEFTEAKIIKLAPGTFQNADCCKKVYKLYTQTDKWGNEIGPALMKVANKVADLWTKVACPPDKNPFRLTGYTIENNAGALFSVRPPVPANQDVYVKASCLTFPKEFTLADGNEEIKFSSSIPAATQWVLYRALMVDDNSQNSLTEAVQHLTTFFQLMKIQYTRDTVKELGDAFTKEARDKIAVLRTAGMVGNQV